ncbi:MAG: TonB-dependent receptor plug domain-containing protein, partial [Chitinophagaceae bacterium]|nr:TonB-dependent receptor plug domain-containing protein [Chitinophagaceae bacterium]
MKRKPFFVIILFLLSAGLYAQRSVHGEVVHEQTGERLAGATVTTSVSLRSVVSHRNGKFSIDISDTDSLQVTVTGFEIKRVFPSDKRYLALSMTPLQKELEGVVVTGTMKAVRRSESPVAVEVYTPQFLKKNPSPSIFESLQNVNGVRPQLNCSVCNTGDIHINGLEGPYTMITIDGMPIVSSLASVY